MPAVIACPSCQTKYNLPDHLLGKAIKCKSCGKAFKTKAPAGASSAQKGKRPASRPAAKLPSGLRNQASAEELARMGLDGPLKAQPDIFAAPPASGPVDPLANHVVQDPGFVPTRSHREADGDDMFGTDDGLSDMYENSAVAEKARLKGGKDRDKRRKEDELLKSYMRDDPHEKAAMMAVGPQSKEYEGLSRLNLFWGGMMINGVSRIIEKIAVTYGGFEFGIPPMFAAGLTFFVLLGYAILYFFRSINIAYSEKTIMTIILPVTAVLSLCYMCIFFAPMAGGAGYGVLALILVGLGLFGMFGTFILHYTMWVFPSGFAIDRKYDSEAWVLTVLYGIGFLAIIGLVFLGMAAGIMMGLEGAGEGDGEIDWADEFEGLEDEDAMYRPRLNIPVHGTTVERMPMVA